MKFYNKVLIVSFNGDNLVSELQYTSNGDSRPVDIRPFREADEAQVALWQAWPPLPWNDPQGHRAQAGGAASCSWWARRAGASSPA